MLALCITCHAGSTLRLIELVRCLVAESDCADHVTHKEWTLKQHAIAEPTMSLLGCIELCFLPFWRLFPAVVQCTLLHIRAHQIINVMPCVCVCVCVLQGLSELQDADLAIADVKLSNVMVDAGKLQGGHGPMAKLIDYGLATHGMTCLPTCHCVSVVGLGGRCATGGGGGQTRGDDAWEKIDILSRYFMSRDSMPSCHTNTHGHRMIPHGFEPCDQHGRHVHHQETSHTAISSTPFLTLTAMATCSCIKCCHLATHDFICQVIHV